MKKIYLINPKGDSPTYFGGDAFAGYGERPVAHMIDLAILTVAALVPDDFEVAVCDEHITPIDYDTDEDIAVECTMAVSSDGPDGVGVPGGFSRTPSSALLDFIIQVP